MADAGYQFITSVIFMMVKRDFDYCEGFRSYDLGLVCDVVVEFGLSEGLVVNFLKLGGLVGDDCVYPGFSPSFVPGGCNAEFGGNSFEAGEGVAAEGLLCVFGICHDIDSCKGSKGDRFQFAREG